MMAYTCLSVNQCSVTVSTLGGYVQYQDALQCCSETKHSEDNEEIYAFTRVNTLLLRSLFRTLWHDGGVIRPIDSVGWLHHLECTIEDLFWICLLHRMDWNVCAI